MLLTWGGGGGGDERTMGEEKERINPDLAVC